MLACDRPSSRNDTAWNKAGVGGRKSLNADPTASGCIAPERTPVFKSQYADSLNQISSPADAAGMTPTRSASNTQISASVAAGMAIALAYLNDGAIRFGIGMPAGAARLLITVSIILASKPAVPSILGLLHPYHR